MPVIGELMRLLKSQFLAMGAESFAKPAENNILVINHLILCVFLAILAGNDKYVLLMQPHEFKPPGIVLKYCVSFGFIS